MKGIFIINGQRHEARWVVDEMRPDTLKNGDFTLKPEGTGKPHEKRGHWEADIGGGRIISSENIPAGAEFFEEDEISDFDL